MTVLTDNLGLISTAPANPALFDRIRRNAAGGWTTVNIGVASQQNGNYTLVLGDIETTVESVSAVAVTFTIPTNANVAFPVGTLVDFAQYGAGQVTIVGAAGVTLRYYSPSSSASAKTIAQYAVIHARQRALNEWWLWGNLA